MKNKRLKLEEYALELAKVASLRSEDPFQKVGACIVRFDKSIAGLGYNGAPSGIEIDWSDRNERRKRVLHAEVNALKYTEPNESMMIACTLLPCRFCVQMIAAYNIKKIIYKDIYLLDKTAIELCKEWNIELIQVN